jgi:hypothetical protein
MNEQNVIDLTDQNDETGLDESKDCATTTTPFTTGSGDATNQIRDYNKTYMENDNLDVFDFLADAEQNGNSLMEGTEDRNDMLSALNTHSSSNNAEIERTQPMKHAIQATTNTATNISGTTRFVPNKPIPKRNNLKTNSTSIPHCKSNVKQSYSTNDPNRTRQQNLPLTSEKAGNWHQHNSGMNEKKKKRLRDDMDVPTEQNNRKHTTSSVIQRDNHRNEPYRCPQMTYDRNGARQPWNEGQIVHNTNMTWRRKSEYDHSHLPPPPPYSKGDYFEKRAKDMQKQERRKCEDMKRTHEEKSKTLNTQSIELQRREKELLEKENTMLKAQLEWDKQKALMVKEMENAKETLDVERVEYEKQCAQQSHEFERRRTEFEQEMEFRKAGMEEQMNDLQEMFKRKQEQLEVSIQQRHKELDARETNLIRQQSELDVRLEQCVTQEKIIADFEIYRKSKEAEFESQRESLRTHQVLLSRQHEDLHHEKESHRKQVELWITNTDTERATLNQRIVDFNTYIKVRTMELDSREAEQLKTKSELDTRAAAQRRRNIQLNAMMKEIDKKKPEPNKGSTTIPLNNRTTKKGNTEPLYDLRSGKPVDYILIDSDDEEDNDDNNNSRNDHGKATPSGAPSKPETTSNAMPQQSDGTYQPYKYSDEDNYNYSFTRETAYELQERLFREAAERMRSRPTAEVFTNKNPTITITTPMLDIAIRYPDHWKWKDPFAILGLPRNASLQLIKTQYRRLARTYHPDKSPDPNTSAKFHSISSAYHKLVETIG